MQFKVLGRIKLMSNSLKKLKRVQISKLCIANTASDVQLCGVIVL